MVGVPVTDPQARPGATQVPSALRKLVVPPPLAGARPLAALPNTSSIAVAWVPVRSSPLAKAPVLLAFNVLAAIWSIRLALLAPVISGVPPIWVLPAITLSVQPASIQTAPNCADPVPAAVPMLSNTLQTTTCRKLLPAAPDPVPLNQTPDLASEI